MKNLLVFIVVVLFTLSASAQIRKIPKIVEDNFHNQYKSAENVEFKDHLIRVDVTFEMDGEQLLASYSNKGIWKETQKEWDYEKLSQEIKDGFSKSKYADREVDETKVLYLPGGVTQYRLRARKSDIEKKYLFFTTEGRLIREAITL